MLAVSVCACGRPAPSGSVTSTVPEIVFGFASSVTDPARSPPNTAASSTPITVMTTDPAVPSAASIASVSASVAPAVSASTSSFALFSAYVQTPVVVIEKVP